MGRSVDLAITANVHRAEWSIDVMREEPVKVRSSAARLLRTIFCWVVRVVARSAVDAENMAHPGERTRSDLLRGLPCVVNTARRPE